MMDQALSAAGAGFLIMPVKADDFLVKGKTAEEALRPAQRYGCRRRRVLEKIESAQITSAGEVDDDLFGCSRFAKLEIQQ